MNCEKMQEMLSVPLADGTRLKIGDHFTAVGVYPFFWEGQENYNGELCWCNEEKLLHFRVYPVSDRVSGRAVGGSISDIPWGSIERREAPQDA
jgi:hypothetical protein